MPRGVYQRKGNITKARPTPAQIQATISAAESIDAFKQHVNSYHRQSLIVTCSAVVCLVVGAHAREGIISQDDTIAKLRHAIMQHGVHDAQVNKYIGVAKALANWLINKYKVGGPVSDILNAQTALAATDGLAQALAKQKVNTLEDLTHLLGKYKRSPVRVPQPAPVAVQAPPIPRPAHNGTGEPLSEPSIFEAAETAIAESPTAAERVNDLDTFIELLRATPTAMLVPMATRSGHPPLALIKEVVAAMNDENELNDAEMVIVDRRMELYKLRDKGRAEVAA